jgi:HSP20 family molecular chaperone IbpA
MKENITDQNTTSKDSYKRNRKYVITAFIIIALLAVSIFLFNAHGDQKKLVQQQNNYIDQLKQENADLQFNSNRSRRGANIASLFDDSWISFKHPLENIADDLLNSFGRRYDHAFARTDFNHVDYDASKDKYEINIALPGFAKDEVSIELTDNILTINAKASSSNTDTSLENSNQSLDITDSKAKKVAKWNNEVCQSIEVPRDINQDQISTSLNNGILTIVIPRNHDVKSAKKIEIN